MERVHQEVILRSGATQAQLVDDLLDLSRVVTGRRAVDALALVRERRPDAVLSDIAMVGQNGYWLVREIRGPVDDAARAVPVVATTAYGREHSRDRVLAAGFNDFLPKPVEPEVLCRSIAKAVGR